MPLSPAEKRQLAHLLRRAGFGTAPDEWTQYSGLGVAGTLEYLLHPERTPDHLAQVFQSIGGDYIDLDNFDSVRQWWLYRMVHTRRPLEEKMTLFWHNHFATANYKVNNARWMWNLNDALRRHGLGNFRTLLQAVARDGAMLVWLDGTQNHNDAPNENFARELMELFTMGAGSGYTENDVREAARSFTGWRYDGEARRFVFDPFRHDDGAKTFFRQTGNFHGEDILDIIVRQPQTARFISRKLWQYFVYENPSEADLKPLEQAYFASGFEIRAVVEAMFRAPAFFSEKAYYALIKSPVEFAVMTIRTLDVPMMTVDKPAGAIAEMGQDLMNPPSVKGWDEGRAWINSRTLLARVNFATRLANEAQNRGTLRAMVRSSLAVSEPNFETRWRRAEGLADVMWEVFLPGRQPDPATRAKLIEYAAQDADAAQGVDLNKKLPGMVNLILSAPEYQLS